MNELRIGTTRIAENEPPYIIAEIGANHNVDFQTCLEMIKRAAQCGVSAVKLQKRNLDMFTKKSLNQEYDNENSYGKTYGEHRAALDWFGKDEFLRARDWAWEHDVDFIVTPFDKDDVDFLKQIEPDAVKIASCDLDNTPLMKKSMELNKPLIISCGGYWGGYSDKESLIWLVHTYLSILKAEFAFLHCVSDYNTIKDKDLNLKSIQWYAENFDVVCGFSSHHPGIQPIMRAYDLGARIIEVHFTLSRAQKGTDHAFSLEPAGLARLCEDIKRIPVWDGEYGPGGVEKEDKGFIRKMGKAIHVVKPVQTGEKLTVENIALKAPAVGLPPYEWDNVVGKIAICSLSTEDTLTMDKIRS